MNESTPIITPITTTTPIMPSSSQVVVEAAASASVPPSPEMIFHESSLSSKQPSIVKNKHDHTTDTDAEVVSSSYIQQLQLDGMTLSTTTTATTQESPSLCSSSYDSSSTCCGGDNENNNNNNNNDNDQIDNDNHKLMLQKVEKLVKELKVLEAARVLQTIKKTDEDNLFEKHHYDIIEEAKVIQNIMNLHLSSPPNIVNTSSNNDDDNNNNNSSSEWKLQGENHGNRNTVIYYKMDDKNGKLTCRIETPIEKSLLIPLISVLNETQLYNTWVPTYKYPIKTGLQETQLLKKDGIGYKITHSKINMPWPMKNRDLIQEAKAIDEIQHNGSMMIIVNSIDTTDDDDNIIPEPQNNVVRMSANLSMMFRKCPKNHPCLLKMKSNNSNNDKKKKKNKKKNKNKKNIKNKHPQDDDHNNNNDDDDDDELLLITFCQYADAKLSFVPQSFINFTTRTVIGGIWSAMLNIAEQVRDGERPLHQQAIENNHISYEWIQRRTSTLLH